MRYRRKIWRLLLAVLVTVLLRGALAQAAGPSVPSGVRKELITIDLDSKVDDFPSDVCVISDLKSPTSEELSPSSAEYTRRGHSVRGADDSWLKEVWRNYRIAAAESDKSRPDALKRHTALNTEVPSLNIESADPCESNEQFCSPEFHLETADQKKHYFIECTGNSADRMMNNRIVILRVYGVSTKNEDTLTQPYITDVSLNKNKVTFNLNYIKSAAEMRTYAVIAGGHYAESEVRAIENKKARLPLISRCQVHELILPSYAGSARASVWLSTDPDDKQGKKVCEDIDVGANRSVRIGLPYERHNQRRTVWVETGGDEKLNFQSYSGHWYVFTPPPSIELRQKVISFQWKRHCMYPKASDGRRESLKCPEASLIEGDQAKCDLKRVDNVSDTCYYRCEPQSHTFDLEAHVRFRGDKELGLDTSIWTEELRYGNQVLDGYVPLDRRHVILDFFSWHKDRWSPWDMVYRKAARIKKIQFTGIDGKPFYYVFEKESNTPIPDQVSMDMAGAECGHIVSYRFIGDRTYEDNSTSIRNGRLVLESPMDAEELLKFRIYGGIGVHFSSYQGEDVQDDFAEPQNISAMLTGAFHYRPFTRDRWAAEGRYSFIFGAQDYFPLSGPSRAVQTRGAQKVWYTSHAIDAVFLLGPAEALNMEFLVGLGYGIIFGAPLWLDDNRRVSGLDFTGSLLGVVQLRLKSAPRWTLEGGGRVLFFDNVYAHETDFIGGSSSISLGGWRRKIELRLGYTL